MTNRHTKQAMQLMLDDWRTDTAGGEYDDLTIDPVTFDHDTGEWVAYARDSRAEYILHAVSGNIVISYIGSRR